MYFFTLAAGESKLGIDFGNYIENEPPTNPTLVPNRPSPQRVSSP